MSDVPHLIGRLARADRQATHRAARGRHHPLVRAGRVVAELADQPPLIALSLATAGAGLLTGRPALTKAGGRMVASHLLATALKTLVKRRVDRTRPERALATGAHRFRPGSSHDHELNSFPSGHTAGAVAVARAAVRELDGLALPAGLATMAVAAVQAPAGKHYLSDVAAGAAIGWAAEALVCRVWGGVAPIASAAEAR